MIDFHNLVVPCQHQVVITLLEKDINFDSMRDILQFDDSTSVIIPCSNLKKSYDLIIKSDADEIANFVFQGIHTVLLLLDFIGIPYMNELDAVITVIKGPIQGKLVDNTALYSLNIGGLSSERGDI